MDKEQIIQEALSLPSPSIDYHVSQYLAEKFPEKVLVEGRDGLFEVEAYARAGHCELKMHTSVYNQVVTRWHGKELVTALPTQSRLLMGVIISFQAY